MSNYLNIIQIITGIVGVTLVFAGLFISIKKLDREDSSVKIPPKTIRLSCILILLGLIIFSITKTCTNYAGVSEDLDISLIYLSSLIDVLKFYGFIVLIPFVLNLTRRKTEKNSDIIDGEE